MRKKEIRNCVCLCVHLSKSCFYIKSCIRARTYKHSKSRVLMIIFQCVLCSLPELFIFMTHLMHILLCFSLSWFLSVFEHKESVQKRWHTHHTYRRWTKKIRLANSWWNQETKARRKLKRNKQTNKTKERTKSNHQISKPN